MQHAELVALGIGHHHDDALVVVVALVEGSAAQLGHGRRGGVLRLLATLLLLAPLRPLVHSLDELGREAAERLAAIPAVELVNDSFFNEFTLRLPVEARPAVHAMVERGVLGGVSLGRLYPGAEALQNGLVVAVTETASDEDIAALEAALKEVCA